LRDGRLSDDVRTEPIIACLGWTGGTRSAGGLAPRCGRWRSGDHGARAFDVREGRRCLARRVPGCWRLASYALDSESTAEPSAASVTRKAAAMLRTVVHVGLDWPRSMRAYAVTVNPASWATASCERPSFWRNARRAAARPGSGVTGGGTIRTLLATACLRKGLDAVYVATRLERRLLR
jgi:hypothetical protein